jgi:hypothetical protein
MAGLLADANGVDARHKAGHDEAVNYKNVIASEAKIPWGVDSSQV